MMNRINSENWRIILGLIVGFCIATGYGFQSYRFAMETRTWPTVVGNITNIVIIDPDPFIHHEGEITAEPKTIPDYPRIVVDAEINGQKRTADFHTPLLETLDYKVGGNVTLHYNPDFPDNIVLQTDIPAVTIGIAALVALVCLIAAVVLLSLAIWPGSASDQSVQG